MNYESLFRHLPVAVAVVDSHLCVLDASQGFARITGMDLEAISGTPLFGNSSLPPPRSDTLAELRHAIESGDIYSCALDSAPSNAGVSAELLHVEIRPFGTPSENGPLAIVTLATVAQALPVDDLASIHVGIRTIKHEINNPLTGALGNINLLLRRPDLDDKTRKRLTTAEQEIKKVSQLVLRLADLLPSMRSRSTVSPATDTGTNDRST